MNDSIAAMLQATDNLDSSTTSGENIKQIHRSKILPDPHQNRNDWDDPATVAHVDGIRKIMLKSVNNRYFGIRVPLLVGPMNEDGCYPLLDGECRWRASEGVPEEIQFLPCLVRENNAEENRLDHVVSNGARKSLTLFQTAVAIHKDKETFKFTNDDIAAIHGLRDRKLVSKYLSVLKLSDEASKFVRDPSFKDINLIYDLQKFNPKQLQQLHKKIHKGDSNYFQAINEIKKKSSKSEKPADELNTSEPSNQILASAVLKLNQLELDAIAQLLGIETNSDMSIPEIIKLVKLAVSELSTQ